MKGMLTGPITILQWSFVRDDQPRRDTAFQIALAIRDEVADLEAAGIGVIQIDEPALREGLPLRRAEWAEYLQWAVDAFRLASAGVRDETQIHTHMCYSRVQRHHRVDRRVGRRRDLDRGLALRHGTAGAPSSSFKYPNEIGPGVYDIHSPRVPETEEIMGRLRKALRAIPAEQLWVNPDCGLKTRGWPEVHAVAAEHGRGGEEPAADDGAVIIAWPAWKSMPQMRLSMLIQPDRSSNRWISAANWPCKSEIIVS